MIKSFLLGWLLPKLLAKTCESRIPRSGEAGAQVDCFVVLLDQSGKPFLMVTSVDGEILKGIQWDGNSYSNEKSMELSEIDEYELRITHYYGLSEITYDNIIDFTFHYLTKFVYLKIRLVRFIDATSQYFFNKKKIVTKKRMELLQFMLDDQVDREHDGVSLFSLMSKLYSIRWVLHPSKDEQKKKLKLYLDSLKDSGELLEVNREYVVTGKAISTIEKYEEEERRHTEAVKLQKKMFWITLAIALMAIVQAGLIKLPPLIDFTK